MLPGDIARALFRAGVPVATDREAGVAIQVLADGALRVRWYEPRGPDVRYDPLIELERGAAILRSAGIRATLVVDGDGPRIVCPPHR